MYSCIALESRTFFKRVFYLKQINFITDGLLATGGPGQLPPLPPPLIQPCLRLESESFLLNLWASDEQTQFGCTKKWPFIDSVMIKIGANFLFWLTSCAMLHFKVKVSPTCTKVDWDIAFTDESAGHNILTPYRGLKCSICISSLWWWASYSGVAKGGGGAVRPWRHFCGGGTMGYGAVGYKPAKAVLK